MFIKKFEEENFFFLIHPLPHYLDRPTADITVDLCTRYWGYSSHKNTVLTLKGIFLNFVHVSP